MPESTTPPPKVEPSSGPSKFSIQKVILEIASIVLAVLLALGLDEWRSSVNQTKLIETALIHVQEEIRWNLDLLEMIHATNANTVEHIDLPESETEDGTYQFLPGLQLRKTAWLAFMSANGASYSDFELILALSTTYSIQDVYKEAGTQLTQSSMNAAGYATALGSEISDDAFLTNYADYLRLLVGAEEALQISYISSLELLSTVLGSRDQIP